MQWSSTGNWKDTYMILKFLAGVRADDMEWVTWLASTEDFDLVLIKLKLYVYSIYRPRSFWSKKLRHRNSKTCQPRC